MKKPPKQRWRDKVIWKRKMAGAVSIGNFMTGSIWAYQEYHMDKVTITITKRIKLSRKKRASKSKGRKR